MMAYVNYTSWAAKMTTLFPSLPTVAGLQLGTVGTTVACCGTLFALVLGLLQARRRRANLLRSPQHVVPYRHREGVAVAHGQLLELGPAEDALVKVSLFMRGSLKVAVAVNISGEFTVAAVRKAVDTITLAQPMLRASVRSASPLPLHPRSQLVFVVDDTQQLPIAWHVKADAETMEEAWDRVWRSIMNVIRYNARFPARTGSQVSRHRRSHRRLQ